MIIRLIASRSDAATADACAYRPSKEGQRFITAKKVTKSFFMFVFIFSFH
jgi:hypothetical protein